MNDELKIAVFASGRGSNFEAILTAIKAGTIKGARIVGVISNNSGSGALGTAAKNNIPAYHISRKQFEADSDFDHHLVTVLESLDANFIALAGYMKKLSPVITSRFRNRIVNVHPALLPEFGGKGMFGEHVHAAVIAAGRKITGATVHVVDEVYDHGAIILQRTLPVSPGDTPATLAEKVLKLEHELYPEAIRLFAEGKVTIDGNRASILT